MCPVLPRVWPVYETGWLRWILMGGGSIRVHLPLFGSCWYHDHGSMLTGIWPAGFESRNNPGMRAPAWNLLFQPKGAPAVCLTFWLPHSRGTSHRQLLWNPACNQLPVAQPLKARPILTTAFFFWKMDHIHTASNFNLKLFIICKDLSQESVHLSLHTLWEGGPEQGGRILVWEALWGWHSSSKWHGRGRGRLWTGSLVSEAAFVKQGIWGWNLCDSPLK